MSKESTLQSILDKIYNSNTALVLTGKEIKKINDYYAKNMNMHKKYVDFLYNSPEVTALIAKMQSGKLEIEKQFNKQLGLQGAILSECNYAQTLANIFELKQCIDLDAVPVNKVPIACLQYIKASGKYISSARYLYYGKDNICLLQYGNPEAGDASIIYYDEDIKIEFKEPVAKAGEIDLRFDDSGKLFAPDKDDPQLQELLAYIDEFNKNTNLFAHLGHNYPLVQNEHNNPVIAVKKYLEEYEVDLVVSSSQDQLIAIKTQDIDKKIDDIPIVSTVGSEIRTAGRNHAKLTSFNYFQESIEDLVIEQNNNVIKLDINNTKDGYGFVKERGKDSVGRYKINYIFFIRTKDIKSQTDRYIIFDLNDVRQLKPTVSAHMSIVATKEQLKQFYFNK